MLDRIAALTAPNGSVAWQVYVQVSCYQPLKLENFPFDRQAAFQSPGSRGCSFAPAGMAHN